MEDGRIIGDSAKGKTSGITKRLDQKIKILEEQKKKVENSIVL